MLMLESSVENKDLYILVDEMRGISLFASSLKGN